MHYTRNTS